MTSKSLSIERIAVFNAFSSAEIIVINSLPALVKPSICNTPYPLLVVGLEIFLIFSKTSESLDIVILKIIPCLIGEPKQTPTFCVTSESSVRFNGLIIFKSKGVS